MASLVNLSLNVTKERAGKPNWEDTSVIDWSVLFSCSSDCQEMINIFNKVIHTGLDILMPIKRVRVNTCDAPWMTDNLKSLIIKRQKAFHEHGGEL